MKHIRIGCVAGRQDIKQATDGYLFTEIKNVHDFKFIEKTITEKLDDVDKVDLYVTGLTAVTAGVVAFCSKAGIELTLWHFDNDTRGYVPQEIVSERERKLADYMRHATYGL